MKQTIERRRYWRQKRHAARRNIPFLLTFEQWSDLWRESGKWDQRGRFHGQYCMARYGDKGAYEIGNVRICLSEENRAEGNKHPWSWERRRRTSARLKGRRFLLATRAKMSASAKIKTFSASHRANLSLAGKGVPKSIEHRAKISAAQIGRQVSAATRAKIAATLKRRCGGVTS